MNQLKAGNKPVENGTDKFIDVLIQPGARGYADAIDNVGLKAHYRLE